MKELTHKQKSKVFKHLFTTIFSVPDVASLPEQVRVTIPHEDMNQTIYFNRVDHPTLRGYECPLPGNHVIIMEQNHKTSSRAAYFARRLHQCAWIWIQKEPYPRLERRWLAFMIKRFNGDVAIFADKHIMKRADKLIRSDTAGQFERPE